MAAPSRAASSVIVNPPFRADIVGSFLRPAAIKQAREKFLGPQTPDQHLGPHDSADLRAVEDRCIQDVIAMQERIGLKAATDGEFRRRSWWMDLIMSWGGFAADRVGATEMRWQSAQGPTQGSSQLTLTSRIQWRPSATIHAFEFLKANTRLTPKVTIPAPDIAHMMLGGDKRIAASAYRDVDAFWADLVDAYRKDIAALIAAGARYIQLDDTCFAMLCDPALRKTFESWGKPAAVLIEEYARRINEVVAGHPADVTFTLHQCRGNREGQWMASGGYDPVADVMFNTVNVRGFFLEYDTARAGGFEPLRLLPKGKCVVLGLVSTKTPTLESADALKRRIDDAAKNAPLEQLCLSPQCGFASSIRGNPVTEADQEAKLRRIVEVATAVWGSA
jgi:5-methyltetrahydropteroyltriglutamate--homocysteine methyltransferase